MDTPDRGVDVVVLTWRDVDQTLACVRSVLAEDRVQTVVVVDNESTGQLVGPLAEIGDTRVVLAEEPLNLGFSAGVNVGIARLLDSPPPLLLVLNNDARLLDGSLETLVEALDERIGMVGPRILDPYGNELSLGGRFSAHAMRTDPVSSGSPDFLTWACVLVDKRVFREVGVLDERFFMYWEDVEFSLRVRRAGFVVGTVPRAVVTHAISSSHGNAGANIKLYSTLGMVVLARNLGLSSAPGALVRILGRTARAVLLRRPELAQATLRGAWIGARSGGRPAHERLREAGVI